jgi:hypothetical protein
MNHWDEHVLEFLFKMRIVNCIQRRAALKMLELCEMPKCME